MLLTGFVLLLSSCYYDKEELLYHGANNGPCIDTAGTISYAQKVAPMLQQYCYSCHSGSFPSGNIAMGTYATDKAIGKMVRYMEVLIMHQVIHPCHRERRK